MGFKEARARAKENVHFQAQFGSSAVMDGQLRWVERPGVTERAPVGGARAVVADVPADDGGSRSAVVVTLGDGREAVLPILPGTSGHAAKFAGKVNQAGDWYATHAFGDGAPE